MPFGRRGMKPRFFASPAEWRRWLAAHHDNENEVWVGFYKKASGRPSISWPESVDEALCFGWIDGIRKSLDELSYVIRFTPRRAGSTWSAVNVRRVKELTKGRRMRQPGVRAYRVRTDEKTAVYSFEQRRTVTLPAPYEREFRTNEPAWRFFTAQAPWYQRTCTWWVITAKREETRLKRLRTLIANSAHSRTIGPMMRTRAVSKR